MTEHINTEKMMIIQEMQLSSVVEMGDEENL